MTVEGVWKVEMKCPFGWGKLETAFLRNGIYRAASTNHYSTGSYTLDNDTFTATIQVTQYDKVRRILGMKKKRFKYQLEAKIRTDGKIVGKTNAGEGKKLHPKMRLLHLGDFE